MALMRAREGIMAPIREMLAESGVTEQQWRVLRVLAEFGPLESSVLADRASLLHPSLTRINAAMAAKGLITLRSGESDRRKRIAEITEAGSALLAAHTDQALRIRRGFQTTLGDEEYEHLLDLLAKLERRRS